MFGKSKRIKELESALAHSKGQVYNLQNQVDYLIKALRENDTEVFSMSQMLSWEGMRPRFQQILEAAMMRKRIESERIGSLIESELRGTYKDEAQQLKRIGK